MPRAADAGRRERGAAVEAAARDYLLAQGLRELASNAGFRVGELDLVMLDAQTLVFVEVRYRRDDRFGGGAASVDARKRRKLSLAAQAFLQRHPGLGERACRFDVVEAWGDPARPRLNWLRDAFRADD